MRFNLNFLQDNQMAVPGFSMNPYMGNNPTPSGDPAYFSRLSQMVQPAAVQGTAQNGVNARPYVPPGGPVTGNAGTQQLSQNNPNRALVDPLYAQHSGPVQTATGGQPSWWGQPAPQYTGMLAQMNAPGFHDLGGAAAAPFQSPQAMQSSLLSNPNVQYGMTGPMGMLRPQAMGLKQLMANPGEIQRRNQFYAGL